MFRIGVLRLVDQDMVGRLVELVADPLTHAGLTEQGDRGADQIIEIDRPQPPLGAGIGSGIIAPDIERVGEKVGIGAAHAQAEQLCAIVVKTGSQIGIIGVLRRLALAEGADVAIGLRPDPVEVAKRCRTVRRRTIKPGGNQTRTFEPVLRPPATVQAAERVQRLMVDA